jgi:hypothetical protein
LTDAMSDGVELSTGGRVRRLRRTRSARRWITRHSG